jgi:hypothetical protein
MTVKVRRRGCIYGEEKEMLTIGIGHAQAAGGGEPAGWILKKPRPAVPRLQEQLPIDAACGLFQSFPENAVVSRRHRRGGEAKMADPRPSAFCNPFRA